MRCVLTPYFAAIFSANGFYLSARSLQPAERLDLRLRFGRDLLESFRLCVLNLAKARYRRLLVGFRPAVLCLSELLLGLVKLRLRVVDGLVKLLECGLAEQPCAFFQRHRIKTGKRAFELLEHGRIHFQGRWGCSARIR